MEQSPHDRDAPGRGGRVDVVVEGWVLLSVALRHDSPELFELLWARKASPASALRAVAETGRVELLERGDHFGKSALGQAVSEGKPDAARALLAAGASLKGEKHQALLVSAIGSSRSQAPVRLLLRPGADPNGAGINRPAP